MLNSSYICIIIKKIVMYNQSLGLKTYKYILDIIHIQHKNMFVSYRILIKNV